MIAKAPTDTAEKTRATLMAIREWLRSRLIKPKVPEPTAMQNSVNIIYIPSQMQANNGEKAEANPDQHRKTETI